MSLTNDLSCYRGEDITLEFTETSVDDITGWNIKFTLAKKRNSATKLLSIDAVLTAGAQYSIPLTAVQTDIKPATYYYDVWRMDAGEKVVLSEGSFEIKEDTRLPTS